ncbi:glycoside hydrolase family 16 protein [Peniophora sp. CONT]|nr:glycoside hydrolase family 16 protein [Peniophora sp. CONT]
MSSSFFVCALLYVLPVVIAQYNLVKEYAGQGFLDDWTFYGGIDNLTWGNATFVDATTAATKKLAYVDATTNHTILRVDNSTKVAPGTTRNSIRINSNDLYGVGSVWVADFLHVPFGCSVWGAFWSTATTAELAPAVWPAGGEIDTFEAFNLEKSSQFTLHTEPGCSIANSLLANNTNCDSSTGGPGCTVTNADPRSYGSAFSQAGGGIFVTEFASNGINIWFFSRSDVPSGLSGSTNSFDTSTLGKPTIVYPATSCAVDSLFKPQSLVFDITLCGRTSGNPAIFNRTCSGTCYSDYVLDPSKYSDAYFEVASVRVFSQPNATVVTASSSPSISVAGSSPTSVQAGSGAYGLTASLLSWSIAGGLAVIAVL